MYNEVPVDLRCMLLGCGRKPENTEKCPESTPPHTHTQSSGCEAAALTTVPPCHPAVLLLSLPFFFSF